MNLQRLQNYAAASYRWSRVRQAEDGAWQGYPFRDLGPYYKAPWCFHAAGDVAAARRSLAHIERNCLLAQGDLGPVVNPVVLERHPLYCHAHVAIGAARADRKDLADEVLDFLLDHRHPDLGAWGDRLEANRPRRFDSISTACAGLALLERGRLEEACAAAEFLVRLLDTQPQPGQFFLSTMYENGVLFTESPRAGLRADRHVRFSGRFQTWWALSFPLLFLARYAEVSGEPRGLRAARSYFDLLERCNQAWDDLSAGKLALGSAYLYRLTGEPRFRAGAMRAVRAIVSRLADDGGVRTSAGHEPGSVPASTPFEFEVNAEFTMALSSVGQAVAQRDRVAFGLPAELPIAGPLDDWMCRTERLLLHQARIRSYQWHRSRLARWLSASGPFRQD